MELNPDDMALFQQLLSQDSAFNEEYQYLKRTPEFKKIHIEHLKTKRQLLKLKELCDSSPNAYCCMVNGLLNEHSVLSTSPDFGKAFEFFKRGADANEPYCLYRLFFVYRNESELFGIEKDPFLQFSFLFRAAAFFDEKDNRFSDKVIDPILHLAVFYDLDKERMEKIVGIYLEKLHTQDPNTADFLRNWFSIKFPSSEEQKKNSLELQKVLANVHPEAAYHIGDNHRWGGETLDKDSIEAEKYLQIAASQNLPKAIESLAIIFIEENDYDKATHWLQKGAALGSYLCIKFLGEYEISGKVLPQNLNEGLKKLKKAFYIGDFWAAWTIIIVYKYIKVLEENIRNKKVYKYSNVLFDSKDIMGNIVYITIRHSSLASCYEKSICLEQNLKLALKLHLDCLTEIKRECWKGYTYYKIGKLYEKMGNKSKAEEFYYKGFKARSDFIKKEHKKEPPHFYNYAKMFEFGRGVVRNLDLAQKYYKLGAEFNSYLSFHLVYGEKCKKRLQIIDRELSDTHLILDYWSAPKLKQTLPKQTVVMLERENFEMIEKIETNDFEFETFNGVLLAENNELKTSKMNKSAIIYRFYKLEFEDFWQFIKNIFVLMNYAEIKFRYPQILGVHCNQKSREIYVVCLNEQKLIPLDAFLKRGKISFEVKSRIISSILGINHRCFYCGNNQLLCKSLTMSNFLVSEKENLGIFLNVPQLLNGEIEKNDEGRLVNELFGIVTDILDSDKEKILKLSESHDVVLKNLGALLSNPTKNWNFEELNNQLNLNQKNGNRSKFFGF